MWKQAIKPAGTVSQKPPLWEPRMWHGQVWEARPHGSQRVARPSLERGMEAASGKKRTPQHEGVTEGRAGNGRKPPYNVPHTPLGIRRAGLLSNTLISQTPEMHPRPFFGGFWHPQWSFARILPHLQGHPQASVRAAGFPDLALQRCCPG